MKGKLNGYLELTKPKVTLLNLLVGLTCFVIASFPSVQWFRLAVFCFAGYMAAGGCGALNCVYDEGVDRLMSRTAGRAIPSGQIARNSALVFGTIMTGFGLGVSYWFFNFSTAFMMVLGIVFYLPVYTILLKRSSSWNVVIGGAAGCFAGLAGWTATGQPLTLTPLLVATVDFFWTPGHLWGLAIKRNEDYKQAKIPMLPATHGLKRASQIVFLFNVVTISVSFTLPLLGLTGLLYVAIALFAGIWLFVESRKLLIAHSEERGFKVFLVSMPYLATILMGLLSDKILFGVFPILKL